MSRDRALPAKLDWTYIVLFVLECALAAVAGLMFKHYLNASLAEAIIFVLCLFTFIKQRS